MGDLHQMVVTVIIPVFNDSDRLRLCLQALEQQTFPSDAYEVLVVDNASTEPLQPIVEAFPHARYLFEAQKGSYAARNQAIAQARGSILAFTDSDCIPYPDWIERGVAALRSDERLGLVGGRIELFAADARRPTAAELFELLGAFQQKTYVEERHYAATANVFTTRKVMDQVGPFDGSLQSGGDRQWGQAVHAAGYHQLYAEDAVVRHPARRTVAELRTKAIRLSEGRYKTRRRQAAGSLPRTLRDIVVSMVPPKRTIKIYFDSDLTSFSQKSKVALVTLYMRYFYARENLRHLWNDYRRRRQL